MSRSITVNPLRPPSDTSAGAKPARKIAAHGHDSDQPHRSAGIVIAVCISRSSSQRVRVAPVDHWRRARTRTIERDLPQRLE
jgi:hypothetical protein